MATSRVIVQRSIADALIKELVTLIQKLKTGIGADANLPSVRTVAFAERVVRIIKEAKEQGAKVLVGDVTNKGSVVQPHLLSGYTPEMRAWKEEIFGPGGYIFVHRKCYFIYLTYAVVGVTICDTIDEAIDLANDTEYSLSGSLWTNHLKALEWASRIKACKFLLLSETHSG